MDMIRAANPYPDELPPLPIEPVRHRLADTGSDRPQHRRGIRLPGMGGAVMAVSIAVAVVIAVVAITTLGHRRRARVSAASPVTSSRQELIQTLGVLRRPQDPSDRAAIRPGGDGGQLPGIFRVTAVPLGSAPRPACPRGSIALPCTLRLDTPLVRAVNVGHGYRAAVFPAKIERSSPEAQRGEGVVLALRGPGLYIITTMTPSTVQELRARGLLLSDYVSSGVDRGVMLVPDGVAQVTLDHFRLLAPRQAVLDRVPPATSIVKDNFAPLRITGLTEENLDLSPSSLGRYFHEGSGSRCRINFAVYALPATAQMTWLSATHTAIRRITISLRLDVGTHHPAPGTTAPIGPARSGACSGVH